MEFQKDRGYIERFTGLGPVALLLAFPILFSACGSGNVSPPTMRPAMRSPMSPPDSPIKALPSKAPISSLPTPAGTVAVQPNNPISQLAIAVADEITQNAKNPFMSKLPEIKTDTTGDPANPNAEKAEAPPPVDPYEGIKLSGIVYNSKSPIALLTLGADNTQFAKKGDVVIAGTTKSALKVLKITRDSVELMDTGDPNNKRTFSLPNIVGYTSEKSANAKNDTGEPAPEESPPATGKDDKGSNKESGLSDIIDAVKGAGLQLQQP